MEEKIMIQTVTVRGKLIRPIGSSAQKVRYRVHFLTTFSMLHACLLLLLQSALLSVVDSASYNNCVIVKYEMKSITVWVL